MDSDRLNRWLTLGANLGVLIGLVVLIVEIGQNTEMMRAQMSQERANQTVQKFNENIHSDYWPAIAAKRHKANNADEWISSLTGEEYQRVRSTYYREINDIRNQFYQYRQGYLPQEIWDTSIRAQIVLLLGLGAALKIPERFEGDAEFNSELRRIAEVENAPFPDDNGKWP
jgi:hypothetical protein